MFGKNVPILSEKEVKAYFDANNFKAEFARPRFSLTDGAIATVALITFCVAFYLI